MNVLFASSEVFPFVKTGGLADVAYNLPIALADSVNEIRVIMPGYAVALENAGHLQHIARIKAFDREALILETHLPQSNVKLWFVVEDSLFNRPGSPYLNDAGEAWSDNALRFAFFSAIVSSIALGHCNLDWLPDVVHCNDWHTGLVPVYMSSHVRPRNTRIPASLFTVHNLAYQGLFSHETFQQLGLRPELWRFEALEYHNQLSFMKGGLLFSDWINTVSPTYANEIKTLDYGEGLHNVFEYSADHFNGVLNGIDTRLWDPERDVYIAKNYGPDTLGDKHINKRDLQKLMGLPMDNNCITLGWVSRFATQKGFEQLMLSLPELFKLPLQLIVLGNGDTHTEIEIQQAQKMFPQQLAVHVGFDEGLAHRIIAGTDFFLMPSQYEPCGLTQMYSQRYGTIPVARATGGLRDSIVGLKKDMSDSESTGILFQGGGVDDLLNAVERAVELYANEEHCRKVQLNGMSTDFSWRHSAREYLAIYKNIVGGPAGNANSISR